MDAATGPDRGQVMGAYSMGFLHENSVFSNS
jgi:hypothetical protein